MPFNFSAPGPAKVAKLGVIHDGDTFVGVPLVLVSGSTATLTLVSTTVTLTGGAGFVSGMTGDKIYIGNATTSGNNGWFTITYISATSVSWTNASGATDANNGHIAWQVAVLGATTLATSPTVHSVFTGPPVRSGVGLWSITTKDNVVATLDLDINTVLPAGTSFWAQQLPDQTIALTGQRKYSWMFHSAAAPGVAADLPYPGSFRLYLVYSETKVGM
jgi:hypothetical protein